MSTLFTLRVSLTGTSVSMTYLVFIFGSTKSGKVREKGSTIEFLFLQCGVRVYCDNLLFLREITFTRLTREDLPTLCSDYHVLNLPCVLL